MKPPNDAPDYAGWLADLADGELTGEALRNALADRIAFGEAKETVERAAREVEIARRIRLLMNSLRAAEIEVPADFEAKLMARVSEDAALLNLLEVYLTAFGQALIELLNALFSLLPEPPQTSEAAGI